MKEALKLALEAFDYIEHNYMSLPAPATKAITAIKEALAQPKHEPVAWMHPDKYKTYFTTDPSEDLLLNGYWTPLYTTPPQRPWIGLTGEEVGLIADEYSTLQGAIRAIEAKLKEKNHEH